MIVGRSNIRRLHHSDATVDPADICAGDAAVLLAEGTDQQDEAVEHKVPPTPKPPPPSPPPRAKERVVVVDRQRLSNEQIVFVVMMSEFDKADVQEQCQQYPHPQQQRDEKLQQGQQLKAPPPPPTSPLSWLALPPPQLPTLWQQSVTSCHAARQMGSMTPDPRFADIQKGRMEGRRIGQ